MRPTRLAVLWRTFFAQFFASDAVSAEEQLRLTIAGLIAFLLVPGLVLLVQLFFDYQGIVLRAIRYQDFEYLTDTLEWVALVFITYSAVAVGLVGAAMWDSLVFDRRDAMVLGPLPLPGAMIVTAKTAAVASLMLAASLAVNLFNACVFAFATADRLGAATLARHFIAHLTATGGAAVFVFCALVVLRGVVGLIASARVAAAVGTLVQFTFVLAVFGIVILCPYVWRIPHRSLVNVTVTSGLPTSWFLGVFEWIRGAERWYVRPLAMRAAIGTAAALAAAALISFVGFHQQMRLALAAAPAGGVRGGAPMRRWIARRLAGCDRVAAGTADFILLTLGRSRAHRTLPAINVAIGVAMVLGVIAAVPDFATLTRPSTAVLWIPLVLAYWSVVGLRAAFFVPADDPAAWIFHVSAPARHDATWSAVRAVLLVCVLPPIAAISLLVTAFPLGVRVAVMHTVFVIAATTVLVEIAALTVAFVPFTRAYQPGRAKLRTRWWLYVVGVSASASWPIRFELWALDHAPALLIAIAVLSTVAVALDLTGRRQSFRLAPSLPEETSDQVAGFTVLDIGMTVHGASRT
jgi:hypothetical protein